VVGCKNQVQLLGTRSRSRSRSSSITGTGSGEDGGSGSGDFMQVSIVKNAISVIENFII
jgi:hypothetical protein